LGYALHYSASLNIVELRGEEPRRAIVAMEMDITGEYVVPKINGWNYYNKPPLFNWVLAGLFQIS
jgi:4-amino-4-deoxy-L-arabinose transferase-like glycosyltransferase